MPFFALQVWTGNEARFIAMTSRVLLDEGARLLWPRRSLRIRRGGVWRDAVAPIFPSYLFLQCPSLDPRLYAALRQAPGFIRFLPSNESFAPLEANDQELLS